MCNIVCRNKCHVLTLLYGTLSQNIKRERGINDRFCSSSCPFRLLSIGCFCSDTIRQSHYENIAKQADTVLLLDRDTETNELMVKIVRESV